MSNEPRSERVIRIDLRKAHVLHNAITRQVSDLEGQIADLERDDPDTLSTFGAFLSRRAEAARELEIELAEILNELEAEDSLIEPD